MVIDNINATMYDEDDSLFFAAEEYTMKEKSGYETWKVMIADDEQEIHNVTKMVLNDFEFEGKSLFFISAYSGEEAVRLIAENPDTAVILLDVVMERDDAGLKAAKHIREELKNHKVRIILRTGQPGQAPERKVIFDYDINDYKEKTELTAQKLFTVMAASLRSYRDITTIDNNKRGLEKIIEASSAIFEMRSLHKFTCDILVRLASLLCLRQSNPELPVSSFSATKAEDEFHIAAATGDFLKSIKRKVRDTVSGDILEKLSIALKEKKNTYFDNDFVLYFHSKSGPENIIYLQGPGRLHELDKYLVEIFSTNISVAFDNIYLNNEVESTQKEIIFTLGEIVEGRSKETGSHVKRVAEISKLLALKYGLSEEEAEVIRLASPMHDIGKLGIPDAILEKPGKLTPEEYDVIKTHPLLGYEMLKNSSRKIMQASAIIALQHHEKYNGQGYPNSLRGEDIHIYGRITAIADVFDAFSNERVYKKAWDMDSIVDTFIKEKGEHFDPVLIDIFIDNLDEVLIIRDSFPL